MTIAVPRALVDQSIHEGRRWWLDELPGVVDAVQQRWALRLGTAFEPGGRTAWVAPARDASDRDLVLKVGWRHSEAEHEAEGLGLWGGAGAVRLFAVERFGRSVALLLERCRPGTPLSTRPETEQDVVVAGLLRKLWLEAPPAGPFRSLQTMCDEWADEFERRADASPPTGDAGLRRDGIALLRSLPSSADRRVVLTTDLHAGNVLSARREPWLVIDPKPYVGDPTYDVLQHLLNCDERLVADPRGLAQRMAALLGLDHDRLMLWLFARCVHQSLTCPSLGALAWRIRPT